MSGHPRRRKVSKLVSSLLGLLLFVRSSLALPPPEYPDFGRTQRIDYSPPEDELLRIWIVFVEQGDGIIIQLPTKYNYDATPNDGDNERNERIDVVVDGGANPDAEAHRLTDFLRALYGADDPTVEHIVITHHDEDHVAGITHLLEQNNILFESVYHNGLASYLVGKRNFTSANNLNNAVMHDNGKRAMAFVNSQGDLNDSDLIKNLTELRTAYDKSELEGVYDELAKAVLKQKDSGKLESFNRAFVSAPFIKERESQRGIDLADMKFELLWPLKKARPYESKSWSKTINGNSVTFRLDYKDFSMMFTGDHNKRSEPPLLLDLTNRNQVKLLDCDVFKVPHHGSADGVPQFFQCGYVLSVASMGNQGFKSKAISGNTAWQHPGTNIIEWLGGPHRVYHTYVHEKELRYDRITNQTQRQKMIEKTHILIETDGDWFRVVEVPITASNPTMPPSVTNTRRGNGTRWVKAK